MLEEIASICLVVCHGGPADHFATFTEELTQEGYEVQVFASGPALEKLKSRKIPGVIEFDAKKVESVEEIAKKCSKASVVMTDVADPFDLALQEKLAQEAPQVQRFAYYDNPEPYVPGGYSSIAAKVMLAAQRVLFSNANLASDPLYQEPSKEIPLPLENRVGVGYYPVGQAEKMKERRKAAKNGLGDKKVLVYFGGANDAYYNEAFPAFLRYISQGDLSDCTIVFQQHPRAKDKNIDLLMLQAWMQEHTVAPKIIISDRPSDEMQVVSDVALFYQTSMSPFFALAGIPMIQVGHETFEDVTVKAGLCPSATNAADFARFVAAAQPVPDSPEQTAAIKKSLGIREDWLKVLEQALSEK